MASAQGFTSEALGQHVQETLNIWEIGKTGGDL